MPVFFVLAVVIGGLAMLGALAVSFGADTRDLERGIDSGPRGS